MEQVVVAVLVLVAQPEHQQTVETVETAQLLLFLAHL
jgi:hypothetical protein